MISNHVFCQRINYHSGQTLFDAPPPPIFKWPPPPPPIFCHFPVSVERSTTHCCRWDSPTLLLLPQTKISIASDELKLRYWCKSVSLICKSMFKRSFESVATKSKNVTSSLLDSWLNLMLLSKLLRFSKYFLSLSFPWVKIKNTINSINGYSVCDCKNLVSSSSINIHV